jgi:penicillin-binding protein 2
MVTSLEPEPQVELRPPRAKVSLVLLISFLSLGLLFGASAYLQSVFGVEGAALSRRNLTAGAQTTANRGIFYDRKERRLVQNVVGYYLSIDPSQLSKPEKQLFIESTAEVSKQDQSAIKSFLNKAEGKVTLDHSFNSEQLILLEQKLSRLDYEVIKVPTRKYLAPKPFSQVIGYTGIVSSEDIKAGYSYQDYLGKYGLETVLENQLKGIKGKQLSVAGVKEVQQALPGNNVFLTIDSVWQRKLYDILSKQVDSIGARAGAVVIMNVDNGDLLAYVSHPTFDPNHFAQGIDPEQLEKYVTNKRRPLVDKVIGLQASPGSTFKVITSYANLEKGIVDENSHIFSTGCMDLGNYPFCEYGKYHLGDLDITMALARSSNIFFCTHSLKLVRKFGYQTYYDLASRLGIGQKTGIELPGEQGGVLPSPEYKLDLFGERWFGGDTCNTVIGQGMVLTTPLQMAVAISTIANGGSVYRPNLIQKIEDQSGNLVEGDHRQLVRKIEIKPKTQQLILTGMRQGVANPLGTGHYSLGDSPGNVRVKTGSAEAQEVIEGKLRVGVHGWAIGTFEHNDQTYAYAVHINFGGGGWNVTHVMKRFLNCLNSNFRRSCENV